MSQFSQTDLERKMITIASGKGGVGKTWVSTTLAHTLSRMGRKVLLFDGDIGLANIDIQLGIMPSRDLGGVISGHYDMASAITHYDDPMNSTGQLDILAGKSGSGSLGTLGREKLGSIRAGLTAMAANYDHIILDLAAGVDASVNTLSNHKGVTVVVLTPDPTSLTDAYAFIKLSLMRDRSADIRVLVNQASSKRDGEKTFNALKKACESFLKFTPPLLGMIKSDKAVQDSIRYQKSILIRHPQSEAAASMLEIARQFPAQKKAMAG